MVSFDDLIPQKQSKYNKIESGIQGAAQGATANFGDEIMAGLTSPVMYAGSRLAKALGYDNTLADKSLGDIYNQERKTIDTENKQALEENPASFITGNVAGAIGTGVSGAATKTGQALANSLRSGGLAGRVGKAALLGAASSGVAGFGSGDGLENRLEASRDSAMAGGVIGGIIPMAGAVVQGVASKKPAIPTSEEIKSLANVAYKTAEEKGGTLKGWFANRFLDEIKDIEPATVAGKKVPANPQLIEALDFVKSFKNTRLSLKDAQNLDEYLGDAIDGFTTLGQVDKSGQKLLTIQRRLRDMIDTADETLIDGGKEGFEALKRGRQLWSTQAKLSDVERIIKRAELTDNPASAIKTGFKNLLTNAKNSRGYSKEELKLIERAANSGIATDLLRTFGSRLIPIVTGAGGGGLGATAGAAAGSAASRNLASRMQLSKADDVARAVASRVNPVTSKQVLLPNPAVTAPAIGIGGAASIPAQQPIPLATPSMNFDDLIPAQPQSNADPLNEKIKMAESGGNPNAQNPNSSASGLYQFTDATWRSAVDKWGRKNGIKYGDKSNPQAQEAMMEMLKMDNARVLQNKGIEPSDANLYFAHFMGAPAASKAISLLGKRAIAARSFPDAAKANPEVFFNKGKPRTIDEVYEIITSKVG
jgi:hypothetical protein